MFQSLPDSQRAKVRLIYKQFPLSMHPWATHAAELADCAALQSVPAFWLAHDFFYANHAAITEANIDSKFADFAKSSDGINLDKVQGCVASKAAQPSLTRDLELGNKLHVTGTPTLFVNGRRVPGVKTVKELSTLIDGESAQAKPTGDTGARSSALTVAPNRP